MSASLLPPASTDLERALVDVAATALLSDIAEIPRNLRTDINAAVAPWLVAEWFLADFAKFHPSAIDLINAGLPWLHQRGTPAAVQRALSWIGLTATLEEDGARLQIDPGIVIHQDQLDDIIKLVVASIPAHVWFYRMYHGYDLRPLYLDRSVLDASMLDDDSGVWQSGVKLSLGTRAASLLSVADDPLRCSLTRIYSTRVWEDNSWRLDAWSLDSEILIDAASGIVSQYTAALPPDASSTVPSSLMRCTVHAVAGDIETLLAGVRLTLRIAVLGDPIRRWTGPWTGTWREAIPSRSTFEVE